MLYLGHLIFLHSCIAVPLKKMISAWGPDTTCISEVFLPQVPSSCAHLSDAVDITMAQMEQLQHAYSKYANNQEEAVRKLSKSINKNKRFAAIVAVRSKHGFCVVMTWRTGGPNESALQKADA